jgi:hypothetical protein
VTADLCAGWRNVVVCVCWLFRDISIPIRDCIFVAHHIAFPGHDWVAFSNNFVNNILGLDRSQTTTQIEHYDNLAALFDALKRINTIILDLNRDMWMYVSMDYFKQKINLLFYYYFPFFVLNYFILFLTLFIFQVKYKP